MVRKHHRSKNPVKRILQIYGCFPRCNGLYEWRNLTSVTPFIGGTLGWAANVAKSERDVGGCIGCSPVSPAVMAALPQHVERETTTHNLAWGLMTGVDWQFATKWSLEFAYRYINLGDVDTGFFLPTDDRISGSPYTSNDILISVLFDL